MAHRLHIRILEGDEEGIGPIWFYKGLATVIADQFSSLDVDNSHDSIAAELKQQERGDYRTYNAIMKKVMDRVGLYVLIRRVKEEDFFNWVLDRLMQ